MPAGGYCRIPRKTRICSLSSALCRRTCSKRAFDTNDIAFFSFPSQGSSGRRHCMCATRTGGSVWPRGMVSVQEGLHVVATEAWRRKEPEKYSAGTAQALDARPVENPHDQEEKLLGKVEEVIPTYHGCCRLAMQKRDPVPRKPTLPTFILCRSEDGQNLTWRLPSHSRSTAGIMWIRPEPYDDFRFVVTRRTSLL